MDEIYCEVTIYVFTDEELFVQMAGYGLVVDVLEEGGESDGLVYWFAAQLEFVVCAYYAELTGGLDHEAYGELAFVVLVLDAGLDHPASRQKMADVLIVVGVDVFVEYF